MLTVRETFSFAVAHSNADTRPLGKPELDAAQAAKVDAMIDMLGLRGQSRADRDHTHTHTQLGERGQADGQGREEHVCTRGGSWHATSPTRTIPLALVLFLRD
jgi:hypothetical protein